VILLVFAAAGGFYLLSKAAAVVEQVAPNVTPPPTTATNGDFRMGILLVEADPGVTLLYVLAENVSDRRQINFIDDPNVVYGGYDVKATDELGNNYRRPLPLNHPTIRLGVVAMRPGEFILFKVPIMEPVEKAKSLSVELPSLVVGSKDVFRLRLPLKAEQAKFVPPIDLDMSFILIVPPEKPGEVNRKVLFKRDDFQAWFEKWNWLFVKDGGGQESPTSKDKQ
jgi:hypothetical protein